MPRSFILAMSCIVAVAGIGHAQRQTMYIVGIHARGTPTSNVAVRITPAIVQQLNDWK